jgi:hypothetical protein
MVELFHAVGDKVRACPLRFPAMPAGEYGRGNGSGDLSTTSAAVSIACSAMKNPVRDLQGRKLATMGGPTERHDFTAARYVDPARVTRFKLYQQPCRETADSAPYRMFSKETKSAVIFSFNFIDYSYYSNYLL